LSGKRSVYARRESVRNSRKDNENGALAPFFLPINAIHPPPFPKGLC
jgi:hypothetical protein